MITTTVTQNQRTYQLKTTVTVVKKPSVSSKKTIYAGKAVGLTLTTDIREQKFLIKLPINPWHLSAPPEKSPERKRAQPISQLQSFRTEKLIP